MYSIVFIILGPVVVGSNYIYMVSGICIICKLAMLFTLPSKSYHTQILLSSKGIVFELHYP